MITMQTILNDKSSYDFKNNNLGYISTHILNTIYCIKNTNTFILLKTKTDYPPK